MAMHEMLLANAVATEAAGGHLSACCRGGQLVFLHGPLGAGKTTLVRGFLRGLGHAGAVKSPTYNLIESYPLRGWQVHHLDLYRLAEAEELEWLGIRDLLGEDAICLIEWPERGAGFLPDPDLHVTLAYSPGGRSLQLEATSGSGCSSMNCLEKLV